MRNMNLRREDAKEKDSKGYYDSYIPSALTLTDYQWTDRHVMTFGLNYYPTDQIVIKAEYAKRFLKEQYNDEPSFSVGVAYSGFFK